MTTEELLRQTRSLLEEHRTTGVYARDAEGCICGTLEPEAVSWCAMGALYKLHEESGAPAYVHQRAADAIRDACGTLLSLPEWSDLATHQEVLDTFDRAAGLVHV